MKFTMFQKSYDNTEEMDDVIQEKAIFIPISVTRFDSILARKNLKKWVIKLI